MNELSGPKETNRPAVVRPPVIWHIASVTDEHQSVTVVFPVTNEAPEKNQSDKVTEGAQE